jgi:hypothetical protein
MLPRSLIASLRRTDVDAASTENTHPDLRGGTPARAFPTATPWFALSYRNATPLQVTALFSLRAAGGTLIVAQSQVVPDPLMP